MLLWVGIFIYRQLRSGVLYCEVSDIHVRFSFIVLKCEGYWYAGSLFCFMYNCAAATFVLIFVFLYFSYCFSLFYLVCN